jgi:hypothetical protein
LKWGQIGPDLLNRVVRERDFASLMQPPAVFCPLPFWEWKKIFASQSDIMPKIARGETRAIHLWHELWRRKGVLPCGKKSGTGRVWQALRRSFGRAEWSLKESSVFAELLGRYGLKK